MSPENRHHLIAGAAMLRAGFADYAAEILRLAPEGAKAARMADAGQEAMALAEIDAALEQQDEGSKG